MSWRSCAPALMWVARGAKVKRTPPICAPIGGCAVASDRLYCRAMDEFGFRKMHSLGNDFVIVDRRAASWR